jgi:hypothetical protein
VKVAEYLYKEGLATAPIPPVQIVESFLKSDYSDQPKNIRQFIKLFLI